LSAMGASCFLLPLFINCSCSIFSFSLLFFLLAHLLPFLTFLLFRKALRIYSKPPSSYTRTHSLSLSHGQECPTTTTTTPATREDTRLIPPRLIPPPRPHLFRPRFPLAPHPCPRRLLYNSRPGIYTTPTFT
jgi:hypothetical protein